MKDFYEYSTPELVRLLGTRFNVAILLKKTFRGNQVSGLQPSINLKMVQPVIFHCQPLLYC